MFRTENALILREVRFKESDRILTALTADSGKMTLAAHGALSKRSRIAAATQQLTYAELTLFEKNGRYAVREGMTREAFQGLRQEIERFALGCYFAECLEQYAGEDQPEPELMQLGLNCLYALSEGLAPREKIKAAFEVRLMAIEGYAPTEERTLKLGAEGLQAMQYIVGAPAKKLLSFRISDQEMKQLGVIAESWLLRCSERSFPTLDYYRSL